MTAVNTQSKDGYQALYRVFRPKKFSDMVGQDHIVKTLKNAIMKDEVSHAYLFTGPRGTGKTSAALNFAKTINCKNPIDGEPCGECSTCQNIANPDIIEIDAASNNGVEEIRDIREQVRYAPNESKYKVYIIDEVHMLTIGAFNALLKTLEEPPAHVVFILATTEVHKVPITIISRCQRFDFKRISTKSIIQRMKEIVETIRIDIEPQSLDVIARAAQGGMRDALSLLDQSIAHAEGKVMVNDVLEISGTVSLDLLVETIGHIRDHNVSGLLDSVNTIVENGKEPSLFLDDLVTYYRDILLYRTVGEEADFNKAIVDDAFKTVANSIELSKVFSIVDELNTKQKELRFSNQAKVLLEVALVKLCQDSVTGGMENAGANADMLKELQELRQRVQHLESGISNTKDSKVEEPTVKEPVVEEKTNNGLDFLDEEEEIQSVNEPTENPINAEETTPSQTPEEPKDDFLTTIEKDIEDGASYVEINDTPSVHDVLKVASKELRHQLSTKQEELTNTLKQISPKAGRKYAHFKIGAVSEDAMVIYTGNPINAKIMREAQYREAVQQALATVWGKSLAVVSLNEAEWKSVLREFVK